MKKIPYIEIDYHKNTLTIAVRIQDNKEIHKNVRIRNEDKIIRNYLKRLSREYTIRACYEASCSGYYFQRKMKSWVGLPRRGHCPLLAS